MKYLAQIILSSNITLNILTRDVIDILHESGFLQIEQISGISYFKDKQKWDTTILQFEFTLSEKNLDVIDYLYRITNNKLKAYKLRTLKIENRE